MITLVVILYVLIGIGFTVMHAESSAILGDDIDDFWDHWLMGIAIGVFWPVAFVGLLLLTIWEGLK